MADEGIHQTEHPAGEIAPPIRYTVMPEIDSQITVKTSPGVACILYREGEPDPKHHLKLYADQDGIIRFHVRPSIESEDLAKVVVECEVGGKVIRYPLELRASSQPTPEFPAPPQQSPETRREGASVRPALSEEEARRLPDEELLKRGYPRRPDPKEAPEAFHNWQRMVSVPATFVEPKTVSHPDLGRGYARNVPPRETETPQVVAPTQRTTFNWSGFESRGAPGAYAFVEGSWIVPSVTGESNIHTYSMIWVGLDGDHLQDLVQAGTGQENLGLGPWGGASSYYAWTEFLPQQPTIQVATDLPINPGDNFHVELHISNDRLDPIDLAGANAWFFLSNLTTRRFTFVVAPRGNTTVVGSEAEWIVERPSIGSTVTDLADYNVVLIDGALVCSQQNLGRCVFYQEDPNLQLTMIDANNTHSLSTVAPIDAHSMQFSWKAFH